MLMFDAAFDDLDRVTSTGLGGGRRRRTDSIGLLRSLKRLSGMDDQELDAVAVGRILLIAAGVICSGMTPLLQPDLRGWLLLAGVTAGMAVLLLATIVVPWASLPPRMTLAFPAAVFLALAVLGAGQPGFFAPLTALSALCFAYIGLTQPPRTSLFVVPVAAVIYLIANGSWTAPVLVRLLIVACVWLVLGELLAGLTARQNTLAAALHAAAHTDALTGVSNRRDLQRQLSRAKSGDAIVICDMDHFKRLNDTLGHDVGDGVLADFGLILRTCLRKQDYCARYGGEEFVLLLPGTTVTDAMAVLARLRRQWTLLQPSMTFSAGVDICTSQQSPAQTLAAADKALYLAKAAGRNTDRAQPSGRSNAPSSSAMAE
jgi:diguanylate cyclase